MKEIIYIQAGSLANYTGTHFWNTQESYFTYNPDDDPIADHDKSFRESLTSKGEPLLCPRLLVFDRKANFGTLARSNALFGGHDEPSREGLSLWNGLTVEHKQEPLPRTSYQQRLDSGEDVQQAPEDDEVRYWSDFNRVYHVPRTIQQLPDTAEWENAEADWQQGEEIFKRHDEENALMEDSLRSFVEECDSLQGIQLMDDTVSFGSFTHSFLTAFRDEYPKQSALTFPILSDALSDKLDVDDLLGRRKVLNDALCLRGMHDLCSMTVPIQAPSTWRRGGWDAGLSFDQNSLYHTSAILSAHIESTTLPLRLKQSHEDLHSICAQLNWRGTRIGEVSGALPAEIDFDTSMFDFSSIPDASSRQTDDRQLVSWTARADVTRGLHTTQITAYDHWSTRSSLRHPLLTSTHAPPYPLPTSFPKIIKSSSPLHSTSSVSSLGTSTYAVRLLSVYARACDRPQPGDMVDADELKELKEDLWLICDGCGGGEAIANERSYEEDEET